MSNSERLRPPWWLKYVNRVMIGLHKVGIGFGGKGPVVLTVPGRKTRKPRSTPVTPMIVDGKRYVVAGLPGSQAHDEIFYSDARGFYRETNHAGGLEGGMTTGEPVVVRAAMKPLPTLTKPLRSVDIATHEPAEALRERTDSATIPAAGVVGEAMVAFVLAGAYREKFGGDHVDDVLEAVARYEERIGWRRR